MNTPRILATTIAAAALTCLAPPLRAVDKFWVTPAGGSFGSIANWDLTDGGPGGDPVPVAADVANFTVNNTYTVTFVVPATTTGLQVENGNVTLNFGGQTYTVTSGIGMLVGNIAGQTGRLTVLGGTLGVDTAGDDVNLGSVAGATGFLTVTSGGILATAAARPDLFVGNIGTGTLTVNDNGQVNGLTLVVGNVAGAAGTVTITGPNAVADFSGTTTIGSSGTGTLGVLNGGTLTSGTTVTLGSNLGADGTATVTGIGSSWTMVSPTIGNAGDGTLTVSAGGLVSTAGAVTLGSVTTGVGTATVTGAGSLWTMSGSHLIGTSGLGVMTVSSGGQVTTLFTASLGNNAGSQGRVTVSGAGSLWTLGSSLTVGSAGTGDLTVSAGGEVFGLSATSVTLGDAASGIGVATITGAGSKLRTLSGVTVANVGSGTLNVASGGEVYVGTNLIVNNPAGAPTGTLNLEGGAIYVAGAFTNNGFFNFTDGLLQVAGNFQPSVAAAAFTINGSDSGDLPTLELIGTGTTTNVTSLTVGNNRAGQLLLRQGRVLNLAGNTIAIGALVGGEGTLSVESGAQLLTIATLAVGGSAVGVTPGGTGTLNIAGGTVDPITLRLYAGGTVNLSSGTLAVEQTPVLDGQFNWTGGTLRFDAAFSLTSANVPKLLGLDATLNAGQALTSTAAVTLQTPVVVDGGALNASTLINQSRLEVRSGSIGVVQNDGLLLGDGTISGAVTNNAAGRIRVDAGKTLFFTGTFAPNVGELNLQGGTLDFTGAITNSATGYIAGRGALFTGGLTNNGQIAFSGGTADLHGDVTNAAGARIITSGGATTTFFDDVIHNGTEIRTSAGCSTVFFGSVSGAGPFTGTGTVYFEGDLRPGNSPASVLYEGDVAFGNASSLLLEIGGLLAGGEYDRLNVAGTLFEDGVLDIALYGGFTPRFGDSFDLFDAGAIVGSFDAVNLPELTGDLEWDATNLQSSGQLRVVPEPGITTLLLAGLGVLGLRRRNRHAAISLN